VAPAAAPEVIPPTSTGHAIRPVWRLTLTPRISSASPRATTPSIPRWNSAPTSTGTAATTSPSSGKRQTPPRRSSPAPPLMPKVSPSPALRFPASWACEEKISQTSSFMTSTSMCRASIRMRCIPTLGMAFRSMGFI